jgi:hypothetical protein
MVDGPPDSHTPSPGSDRKERKMRTSAPRTYRIRRRNTAIKAAALIGLLVLISVMIAGKMLDHMVWLHGH